MKKKNTTKLQAMYNGSLNFYTPYKIGKWFKWKTYRDEKTAIEAKNNLERKFHFLVFRVVPA